MHYLVEIHQRGDGSLLIAGGGRDGVYRVSIGDSIQFKFYSYINPDGEIFLVDIAEKLIGKLVGVQKGSGDPYLWTPQWVASTPGPVSIRFSLPSSDSLSSFFPVENTILVNPDRRGSDVRMLTVMPRRLGPISGWPEMLSKLAKFQNYNSVHLTPCQPSGASHSSYSIRDVLDVDPALFPLEELDSPTERWRRLKSTLDAVPEILKFTDVVLNHASSCSDSWAMKMPQVTYCIGECPYLRGAAELDQQLQLFSSKHPEYLRMDSEEVFRECIHGIRVVLEKFQFDDFFLLDIHASALLWQTQPETKSEVPGGLWQALQQCGVGRGHRITIDLRSECDDIASVWRTLHQVKESLAKTARACFSSALEACESTIRYERFREKKMDGPLLPHYFSRLANGDMAANNGWVMNWPAGIDFASPGHHLVYMCRHVVAWGDCVKLRYAEASIWAVMEEYCSRIASTFDGIRLDNCHSTPIDVLRRLVGVMRRVNPNILIVAELFTGEAMNDEVYEATVGIDLLVKEGMQISSIEELMGKLWQCSHTGIADVEEYPTALPRIRSSAILYDATHDNSTCETKLGSFQESLPLAAAVAAAPCAVGSSVGFDNLCTVMPSVVTTTIRARCEDCPSNSHNFPSSIWLEGYESAKSVSVYGDWDDWEHEVELERVGSGWKLGHTSSIRPIVGKTEYKFFVNQVGWVLERSVAMSSGVFGNNVYGTSSRFSDVKRQLLEIHEMCRDNFFYSEIINGNVLVVKRLNNVGEGYIWLIRFGFAPSLESTCEIELESRVEAVSLAVSLDRRPGSADTDNLLGTHFNHTVVFWSDRQLGFECLSDEGPSWKYALQVPQYGVVVLKVKPIEAIEKIRKISPSDIPLDEVKTPRDLSYLLFGCEAEEPVYDVPGGMGKLVFAGFAGIINAISDCDFLASPLAQNIREGDWLFDFSCNRLEARFPRLHRWLTEEVRPWYVEIPSGLKPKWFEYIFRQVVYKWKDVDPVRLATLQFTLRETVAAGLPHFASGYMRCWGRDTFIAFPGLFLATNRFDEAKACLLAFARVVRHGLIPNLFDDGINPRYNARDAVWCFLNSVRKFIEVSGDDNVLTELVELKYADRAFSPGVVGLITNGRSVVSLGEVVEGILLSHLEGIDFVEENAGPQIDEHMTEKGFRVCVRVDKGTGLVIGGNDWNCGTWMDKMGSVEGVNRGIPATSRFGANIEINGLALAVLNFFSNRLLSSSVKLRLWCGALMSSWEKEFWSDSNGWYNDTIRGDPKGGKLRPNGLFALSQIPLECVDIKHAAAYILKCEESLLGPLGMRTLAATDSDYNGWYDNSDASGGYNYHNGPEWVWLTGHYLMAARRFKVFSETELMKVVARLDQHKKSSQWRSLPELTNMGGAFCQHSCPSQAWSVCCFLEFQTS